MWHHTTWPLTFTLAVEDNKNFSKKDAIISSLLFKTNTQSPSTGWVTHTLYSASIGNMTKVMWKYPCLIRAQSISKIQHPPPCLPQHAPHAWTAPVYGQKTQYATEYHSTFLDKLVTSSHFWYFSVLGKSCLTYKNTCILWDFKSAI